MKPKLKYLYALAAVLVLCGFKYSNQEGESIPGKQQMEILHYHGHTYVCYRIYYNNMPMSHDCYGSASIVHDPDCKCGKGGGR